MNKQVEDRVLSKGTLKFSGPPGLSSKEFMDRHREIMDMCEVAQKTEGGNGEMKNEINSGERKENYERGFQHGYKVHCGQDLRDLIGLMVTGITSDENDMNVVMYFEDEDNEIRVYLDNMCLDGESISMVDNIGGSCEYLLRPVTEADLKEISSMTSYYDSEIVNEKDEIVGVDHIYCNDISLEETDHFKIKKLYVFHDGQIMTDK
ncbi:hypothetical protein DWX43_19125 [Clostridium sp. AF19-22AC]|jgi:hypothetical protein|nr:hypothetical protein DWX43_19125 [Clostridium sp. AF19-22AC]DAQ34361.1 MAG TPA: hypothetical protein [Caudoviricetes sp.]